MCPHPHPHPLGMSDPDKDGYASSLSIILNKGFLTFNNVTEVSLSSLTVLPVNSIQYLHTVYILLCFTSIFFALTYCLTL